MTLQKTSAEVLNSFLEIPGIQAIEVIGRDGFLLDVSGNTSKINQDALSATVALVCNGIEDMGREIGVLPLQASTIEYAGAMIILMPVADAIAAIVCPDAKMLGIIRLKIKNLIPELAKFY